MRPRAWFCSRLPRCHPERSRGIPHAAHAVSLLAAVAAMLALNLAAGRLGKSWLKEWAMALSVLCGILAGALTAALL